MKRILLSALLLALFLPVMAVNAYILTAYEGRGIAVSPRQHGSLSCRYQSQTAEDSDFDIIISYWEDSRGRITSAAVFTWEVPWHLEASWSWHAYGINIEVRQRGEKYNKHCRASARY